MKTRIVLIISIACAYFNPVYSTSLEEVKRPSLGDLSLVDTDGSETFFISEPSLNNSDQEELPTEMYLTDRLGVERLHPFSSDSYPYAVMGKIQDMNNYNGYVNFELDDLQSPYTDRLEFILKFIQDGYFELDHDNMIFLKEDQKSVADSLEEAQYIIIKNALLYMPDIIQIATLPGEEGTWRECDDRNYVGNYTGYRCFRRGRSISKYFKSFLDKHLLNCINESLRKIDQPRVSRVGIKHAGISGDQRHRRAGGSYHNIDRAIDVKEFYFPSTKLSTMNYRKAVVSKSSKERKFFEQFRSCYQRKNIERSSKCKINKKTHGYVASIGWEDKNHRQHIHVSYPFCGGKKGYYKL